jgi:hypothetical protein
MILTKLKGGLGNQMFQYAAGLALAERRRTVLKLDVSWFEERPDYEAHNRYALSCLNITEQFATAEETAAFAPLVLSRSERLLAAAARRLRFHHLARIYTRRPAWHRPPTFAYYPGFSALPDGSAIEGFFQSEKFFAEVSDLLRLHFSFRYPPPPEVAATAERIRGGPSAAVHFRRGDFVRNPAFAGKMGVVDYDYYREAIRCIRERSPHAKLYLFSDDIDAIAREFTPPGPHEFVRCVRPWHAYDKIRLMSQCEHIAVANSSFSWWAAWLNPSPDKLVIAPDPWFVGKSDDDPSDIVPAGWRRIPGSNRRPA